jgi:hypothetical protein
MEYTKNKINKIHKNPNSRADHRKVNHYVNSNNKSSKYFLSSEKKSQNQNYTIDSDNNKIITFNEEENEHYKNLANNIRIQNKILDIYQKWINTLISVIDNNKINGSYNDIGTPIQENLEYIEKLKEENFKLKELIINQKIQNENKQTNLEKKQKSENMIIKDFNEKELKDNDEKMKLEKQQLIDNVQLLANELDEINENNKNLNDKIMKDKKLSNIYNLVNLRNQLKQENKLYKKIVVLKNRKNYIELKQTLQNNNDNTIDRKELRNKRLFSINANSNKKYGALGPISRCGDYKLEQEENIHSNGNIFFCGL